MNLSGISFVSCQTTKVFDMKSAGAHEFSVIKVKGGRVIQECSSMNAKDENVWRHQYRLHVLNEKNEVISLYHPINQDIDTCNTQLEKIERVLKNAKAFRICARDTLEKDDHKYPKPELHDFGPLGKHETPYNGLTFDTICNERNYCFSISETWVDTCPGFNVARP